MLDAIFALTITIQSNKIIIGFSLTQLTTVHLGLDYYFCRLLVLLLQVASQSRSFLLE